MGSEGTWSQAGLSVATTCSLWSGGNSRIKGLFQFAKPDQAPVAVEEDLGFLCGGSGRPMVLGYFSPFLVSR